MLSNTGSAVDIVLEVYDGETDASSVNPLMRFSGLTAVATSPAVSVSTPSNTLVSFEFDLSAYTLTANTYSFWLKQSAGTPSLVGLSTGGTDGGAGNIWGTLGHEVYGIP